MKKEGPLYEDSQLKVTLLQDFEGNVVSGEDHELHITSSESRYIIQRGILAQIAGTSRDRLPDLLDRLHPLMLYDLEKNNLTPDSIGVACCQAYMEEQRRFELWNKQNEELIYESH